MHVFPVAVLMIAFALVPARAQDGLEGRTLQHTFERAPFRSAGLERLEDLRGAPVWIEFWSSTSMGSYGVTVPTAVKLQEKHGDDVHVVCVEVGGLTHDEMARFVLQYRWAGSRVVWATESPMSGPASVPWAAVVGPDGELLASASSLEDARTLTDALEDALAARRKGPKGTPSAVAKAWAEFSKGRLGRALAIARAAAAKAEGKSADTVTAARLVEASIHAAAEARLARAGSMLASGHYGAALQWLEALSEAVDGDEALGKRVATLRLALESEEAKAELEADARLAKLERKLYAKGLDDGLTKSLTKLAGDAAGTQAASRARELAALARED
ncbi:MAG: TlpA family protein disulfide reductase [Planctomycetota bacterium]|jgi:hypothetical protein